MFSQALKSLGRSLQSPLTRVDFCSICSYLKSSNRFFCTDDMFDQIDTARTGHITTQQVTWYIKQYRNRQEQLDDQCRQIVGTLDNLNYTLDKPMNKKEYNVICNICQAYCIDCRNDWFEQIDSLNSGTVNGM
jgi:hypothetical protein